MKEVRGSGPFCSLIMAVVVVKDVLVFLAFSLALNNAQQVYIYENPALSIKDTATLFLFLNQILL